MPVLSVLQDTISVDVGFYDDADRAALLQYPRGDEMQELVANPVRVSTAEFLSYSLFHRKRVGTPGYKDYQAIAQNLHVATALIDGCLDLNGHSISTARGARHQLTEISEHVGEGIGLSIVSRLHNLTEADWEPIPQQHGPKADPTFDFELASDGENIIQAENKGSSVPDNRVISPAVKEQKRRITKKKTKLKTLAATGADPNPANLRYGTITVIDGRRDGNVRCWLTDPPPEQIQDPRSLRLLQRMRFLHNWISFISVRSHLAVALSTRLADLESMRDPFELNGVPLRRGSDEPFDFLPYDVFGEHSTFLATKSRITDGPAGGEVVQLSERALFLIGIREELLVMASEQDFDRILTYRAAPASIEKTVECVFSESRFQTIRLPPSVSEITRRSGGYISFEWSGLIHYSPAGLVFGLLPLPIE